MTSKAMDIGLVMEINRFGGMHLYNLLILLILLGVMDGI